MKTLSLRLLIAFLALCPQLGRCEVTASSASVEISRPLLNIGVRPLALLFGIIGGEIEWSPTERFALGLSGRGFNVRDGSLKFKTWEIGLNGTFFLSNEAFKSGWIFKSGIYYSPIEIRDRQERGNPIRNHATVLTATAGYFWQIFDWNLTASLSAGPAFIWTAGGKGSQPFIEALVGWSF